MVAAFVFGAPITAHAQQNPDRLRDIERQRLEAETRNQELAREAERLTNEARQAAKQAVALAADIQAHERAIEDLRDTLAKISRESAERNSRLTQGRARMAELLAALQRIARHPPEALMAYTRTPQDALRGAMLLRAAIPQLESRARKLKDELAALARLGEQAAARSAALAREREGLAAKRADLAKLAARQRDMARTTRAQQKEAAARAQALTREARSLRDLLARIEKDRSRRARQVKPRPAPPPRDSRTALIAPGTLAPPAGRISRARGRLVSPVTGTLAGGFGDRASVGGAKGASFATRRGAQVVAPFAGEVLFSGPFRGYGPLLIIDHGEGYHSLLAGLGRLDAAVGQRVLAGEPVGIMSTTAKRAPKLYLELRQGGRPIDPLPWLATSPNSKVSG